jgi:hypothetical protein
MRQILIVHSATDKRFEVFFTRVFSSVQVRTAWETYESIQKGSGAREGIQKKISESDALFFVLSQDQGFAQTAPSWFPWATDLAKDKDLWVFEHCEDLKRVQALVPRPGNYVAYYITNAWTDYVRKAAEAYEKPPAAPAPLPEALCKALTPGEVDALFDPATGLALFDDSTARAAGLKGTCPNCSASYGLHVPTDMKAVRCPACGHFYGIQQPPKAAPPPKG